MSSVKETAPAYGPPASVAMNGPGPGILTSSRSFKNWRFSLDHDFEKDGEPAVFAPGHPKPWGSETADIHLPDSAASCIALNANDSLLAVAVSNTILVYSTSTLQQILTLRGHVGHISHLEFFPSGSTNSLVSSSPHSRQSESQVRIWDLDEEMKKVHSSGVPEYITAAVDAAVASATTELIQRGPWSSLDVVKARMTSVLTEILLAAQNQLNDRNVSVHEGSVASFDSRAFSRGGAFLLYVSRSDNILIALDASTRRERLCMSGHTDHIMWAETSPDDSIIGSSAWDRTVRLWDASSGALLHTLTGAEGQSWGGAFSPDGRLIAAGSGDRHVRIWNTHTGDLMHTLGGFEDWVRSVSFSPSGSTLAAGAGHGMLRLFDVSSGECTNFWHVRFDGLWRHWKSFIEVLSVRYDAEGNLFFRPTDGRTFVYNAKKNVKWQMEKPDAIEREQGGKGNTVVSTGQLGMLVSADYDAHVRIWRLFVEADSQ